MTKKEIKDANKLIGAFDGWVHCGLGGNFKHHYRKDDKVCHINDFEYHSNWNWLMEVVDKIELVELQTPSMTSCRVRIECNICGITNGEWVSDMIVIVYDGNHSDKYTKLSATYEAVFRFIKWYNERKK